MSGIGAGVGMILDLANNELEYQRAKSMKKKDIAYQKEMADYYYDLGIKKFKETGYEAQAQQLRDAGMNIGLMYGSAGQGGQSTTPTSPTQEIPFQPKRQGIMDMAALENARANTELTKAQVAKIEAETENIEGKTATENETRDILVANMKESGISQWMDNVARDWQRQYSPDDKGDAVEVYQHAIYGTTQMHRDTWEIRQLNEDILKTISEKDLNISSEKLNNKKVQYYWNELMNATAHAKADMIRAYAEKLSKEWTTGEYTNWKTWADLADKSINTVGNLIKGKGTTETTSETIKGETLGGDTKTQTKTTTKRK